MSWAVPVDRPCALTTPGLVEGEWEAPVGIPELGTGTGLGCRGGYGNLTIRN